MFIKVNHNVGDGNEFPGLYLFMLQIILYYGFSWYIFNEWNTSLFSISMLMDISFLYVKIKEAILLLKLCVKYDSEALFSEILNSNTFLYKYPRSL